MKEPSVQALAREASTGILRVGDAIATAIHQAKLDGHRLLTPAELGAVAIAAMAKCQPIDTTWIEEKLITGFGLDPLAPDVGPIPRRSDWQPIETAPKDGTLVLLWEPNGMGRVTGRWEHEARFVNGILVVDSVLERWNVSNWILGFTAIPNPEPTYWMPLPEPPG